jgi:hypothetical protein
VWALYAVSVLDDDFEDVHRAWRELGAAIWAGRWSLGLWLAACWVAVAAVVLVLNLF